MDEILKNPFLCILEKSYPSLYKSLFNDVKYIILLPVSQSLINMNITQSFIVLLTSSLIIIKLLEKHILRETNIKNNYVNKSGQIVELLNGTFVTSYGFNNHNICNIIQQYKIPNTFNNSNNNLQIYLIDSHLLVSNNTELTYLKYNIEEDIEIIIKRWCDDNEEFKKYFMNSLNRLKKTFVLVPGYESETSNILSNIVDKSMLILLVDKKDFSTVFKRKLFEIALNYSYYYLYDLLWNYLSQSYVQKEEIIQNRILKLRNELNLNLSLLIFDNRHEVSNINILPSVESLHQMEKCLIPNKKMEYLDKAIMLNNCSSDEEAISFIILAIVVGGLKNAIVQASFLDMYVQSLGKEDKNLQIFHSAISFLLN